MPIWLMILTHAVLILIVSSSIATASITSAGFPSSIIQPEQLNLDTKTNHLYKERFFTQILDHFNYNPQSYHTFQQRYLINTNYWGGSKNKSPIFVYTGNEGDIEWFAQNTGFMFETAPRFRALLVFIEHRYYGKSMPFGGNKEESYSNSTTLGYLSSTQALADYATLITDLKKNLTATDSPVIVFGGSYGGMLAAWFRLKYPHIAIGALASSAPILNFDNITSPYSFNNIITQDFRQLMIPSMGTARRSRNYMVQPYTGDATCFDLNDDSDPHELGGWTWQACTEMILLTDGNTEESIDCSSAKIILTLIQGPIGFPSNSEATVFIGF